MGQTIKSRNICLNFFEILACIMIIFIHASFPGHIGEFIDGLARFGVPLFFVISGYYLFNENITIEILRGKLIKRIKKILILTIISFVLYFMLQVILNRRLLNEYFSTVFTIKNLFFLLIFNEPLFNPPTWFLLAMLYAYIFLYLLAKFFLKNDFLIIFFACLTLIHPMLRIFMFQTKWSIYGLELSSVLLYRNWYFDALPFICLGIFIKKNKKDFEKINLKLNIALIILFFIASGVEECLYIKTFGMGLSVYFSNIFCVSFIMIFTQKKPNIFSKLSFIKNTGTWTMLVYILHPAMIFIVRKIVTDSFSDSFSEYLFPLVVAISTVIVVSAICYIIRIIKKRTQKNELTP